MPTFVGMTERARVQLHTGRLYNALCWCIAMPFEDPDRRIRVRALLGKLVANNPIAYWFMPLDRWQ